MSSRALDTNVLLRYLTADDPEQSPIAGRLIDQPEENSDDFLVTIPVVCELTWLLRSRRYGFDREQIADAWEWLLGSSRFRFQMRPQIAQAVDTFILKRSARQYKPYKPSWRRLGNGPGGCWMWPPWSRSNGRRARYAVS
jgi:predicted nucleic-acid-binding protein